MKGLVNLYIILIAITLVNLINTTLFSGKWDGIVMWINLGLFVVGTFYFSKSRNKNQ